MTRLSHIHPYPAMIADELATELSQKFVKPGYRVLDPFCGTGRTLLAAAECGAECIGIDINPLAALLTRAKASHPRVRLLQQLLLDLPGRALTSMARPIRDLELGRKVEWFSLKVKKELSALIRWMNHVHLGHQERIFLAAILSATAREVSYGRVDQWKLHRISQEARARFYKSPWAVFERRLRSALQDLARSGGLAGTLYVVTGDTRKLSKVLRLYEEQEGFDVVITSPPYGDSRTTVQYGAMSGICLGVLRHLQNLDLEAFTGGEIDRRCLGGQAIEPANSKIDEFLLRPQHWWGGLKNPARERVRRFLWDLNLCVQEITNVLREGGRAVFVVGHRSVGGWQLKLDHFLIDAFARCNLGLEGFYRRRIEGKTTPLVINKRGRMPQEKSFRSRVPTIREEHVLVFQKF